VARALDSTRIAHVAAHGNYRSDNPLFSSIQLDDGHLTVYDLERLRRPPELLVLSACESGLNSVQPGDELLGLTASLLSLGTRSLIASVVPVHDETTAALMVQVHHRLRAGADAPTALRDSQVMLAQADTTTRMNVSGFVSFGA